MQKFLVAAIIFLSLSSLSFSQNTLAGYDLDPGGRKIQLTSTVGKKLILTAYGESIIRVQPLDSGTQPFSDDRYGMLETHDWPGSLLVEEEESILWVYLGSRSGCRIQVNKQTLAMSFYAPEQSIPFLREKGGTEWSRNGIATSFVSDPKEKFTGLGHGYFGRETSLDLSGRAIQRNYGRGQGDQAPLIVPFFLSNKGYGLFLNSSFPNKFIFNRNNQFEVSLTTRGYDARMDYFVIWGADMAGTLDQYTQLTGRPRMPRLAYFGLAMSDKAQEAQGEGPQSDENWWKEKILAHREAGYPLDHVVNDNQWRAGGGTRLKSVLDWERERYPDPAAWRRWTEAQGLIVTVDFNRGMAKLIPGWKPEFNIPLTRNFDIVDAAPDFTHPELRRWFWEQFWEKAARGMEYPADAFWIDEFDQLGGTSSRSILADGRPWYEVKNLWFHLIAETLVRDGWDKEVEEKQRPFVWIRGATAGTQRYATLWTGDIQPNDTDMAAQVVSNAVGWFVGFSLLVPRQWGFLRRRRWSYRRALPALGHGLRRLYAFLETPRHGRVPMAPGPRRSLPGIGPFLHGPPLQPTTLHLLCGPESSRYWLPHGPGYALGVSPY
jgi:alpha-glucosidase (family GH31 glycosyl hydrolase)